MAATRRCAAMCRHLHPPASLRQAAGGVHSTPTAASSSADVSSAKPAALLLFDMQPEQVAEDMIATAWLPAANDGPSTLSDLADVSIAASPVRLHPTPQPPPHPPRQQAPRHSPPGPCHDPTHGG